MEILDARGPRGARDVNQDDETREAVIRLTGAVERLVRDMQDISEKLDGMYATNIKLALMEERQGKVEKIVYGAIGIILLAVGTAITALVVGRGKP